MATEGSPKVHTEIALVCSNGGGEPAGTLLEDSLRASSLVVEKVLGGNNELFLKVGATWDILGLAAETLRLRKATLLGVEAVFKWDDEHMFVRQPTGELFTWTERYRCLDYIIRTTTSDRHDTIKMRLPSTEEIEIATGVALVPLLEKYGFIQEQFPLHVESMRTNLLRRWALNWFSFSQPLDEINAYFGSKIAIYFAFLGMYTKWLWFIATLGLVFYAYDWGEYRAVLPASFGVVVVLWAVLFLQFWKRRNVELTERWEIVQGDDEVSQQKSQWEDALERQKGELSSLVGPTVRGKEALTLAEPSAMEELKEEEWTRSLTSLASNTAALLGVLVMQLPLEALYHHFLHTFSHRPLYQYALTFVYVAAVGQLTAAGGKLGMWLNSRQTFVSGEAAADSLVAKVFATYFVQSSYGLAYTALFHRDFAAVRSFLLRRLLVAQVLDNITESLIPFMKYRYNRYKSYRAEAEAKKERGEMDKARHVTSDVERQWLMAPYVASVGNGQYDGVFDDFLELALQFGLVTMFACCFPLVGVFSLLNNLVEIHSDSFKLLSMLRRPVPHKVASMGSWFTIFQQLGVMAIVSNCVLVVYMYGEGSWHMDPALILVLVLEHALLLSRHGIAWFIPEEPAWVKVKRRKRARPRDHFSAEVLRAFGSKRHGGLS